MMGSMAPIIRPVGVPHVADPVLPPRLVYGELPLSSRDGDRPPTALYYERAQGEGGGLGRVTFEELDAVRAARGERPPYDLRRETAGEWVFSMGDSPWLRERHEYETRHYDTPLLDAYQHYVFLFHDQFVEAIAQGIWFDTPDPSAPMAPPAGHPLDALPDTLPAETHRSPSGIEWELRRSPDPAADLLRWSELCSQHLYQFNLVLDGRSSPAASVWLRSVHGVSRCRMTRPWAGEMARRDGLVQPEDFFEPWEGYVGEVAARRRQMGRPT